MGMNAPLSEPLKKQIREGLQAQCGGAYRCPMCRGEAFTLDPDGWTTLKSARYSADPVFAPTRNVARLTCDKCGFVALHAPHGWKTR